jgi:hypothetical protein
MGRYSGIILIEVDKKPIPVEENKNSGDFKNPRSLVINEVFCSNFITGGEVSVPFVFQRWVGVIAAEIVRQGTASIKTALVRRVYRRRDAALDRDRFPRKGGIRYRHG